MQKAALSMTLVESGKVAYEQFRVTKTCMAIFMSRYSRGDAVPELRIEFDAILLHWCLAEEAAAVEWSDRDYQTNRTWALNIDRYIQSFWMVGLALVFDVSSEQWNRLSALLGNEGEDGLLDTIMATREPTRAIGRSFCYPMPYGRLWEAAHSPRAHRNSMFKAFVENWYSSMFTAVSSARQEQARAKTTRYPYWMGQHSVHEGEYFGYWCVEGIAAAVALRLDDRRCVGHPHYPGDLTRPVLVTPPDLDRLPRGLF